MPHKVAPDDDGIRPAGPPDACFYCQQKVGQNHKPDCVTVESTCIYRVILNGEDIGTWSTQEPDSWGREQRYFHKNLGSWCTGNMRDFGTLKLTEELPSRDEDACLCSAVELVPEAWG